MRVLFALVVFDAYPKRVPTADPEKVVGLARLVSLDWLAEPGVLAACKWILIAALILYSIGVLYVISLPVMAFLIIAPATLANSQGAAHHHLQVLGLVLLAQ